MSWKGFWDVVSGARAARERAAQQEAAQAQYQHAQQVLRDYANSGRQLTMVCGASNVDIYGGEQTYCVLPGTALYEPRLVRSYVGGSSGVSFRVAKGVTIRTGASRGHAEYSNELRQTDTGDFIITNTRLIFAGAARTVVIDFKDIVATEPMSDGLRLNKAKREKAFIFGFDTSLSTVIDGATFNATGDFINAILAQAKLMQKAPPGMFKPRVASRGQGS